MESPLKILVITIALCAMVMVVIIVGSIVPECGEAFAEESSAIRPVSEDEWSEDTKLWLARSVLGEVGWRRFGEYSAVAWVYSTRAKQTDQHDFLSMVKAYSAAIRSPGRRRNPWLFELDFTNTRPTSWPTEDGIGPLWKGLHDQAWIDTLTWADEWAEGKHLNPCPGANHFGAYVDRHRAQEKRWRRIKCEGKTRNRFYTSLSLVSKRQALTM